MPERLVLRGLVNGHDHLDFSTFPALGSPPYASVYEWARDVDGGRGDARARRALAVPLADRLFLGALRNLLCGVTAVVHHGEPPREPLPVHVLGAYRWAHSPGLTPDLESTFAGDGPWLVHAAEGVDERCGAEIADLQRRGLLTPRTVVAHAIAAGEDDALALAAAQSTVVWCPESNLHLYGATADVAMLRAHAVRIALGSDSPVSGVRDPASNLAAARGALDDLGLLRLAASDPFGFGPRADDEITVSDVDAFLAGDRRAVARVVVDGRALYGRPDLVDAPADEIEVDGAVRALARGLAERARRLLPTAAAWTQGLRI